MEITEKSDERMVLEYGCGRALIGRVRSGDYSLVDVNRQGLVHIRVVADLQNPELKYLIPRTVMHLQKIADLIEERKELWREIERHENSRKKPEDGGVDEEVSFSEDAALFERLLDLCQRIARIRRGEQ